MEAARQGARKEAVVPPPPGPPAGPPPASAETKPTQRSAEPAPRPTVREQPPAGPKVEPEATPPVHGRPVTFRVKGESLAFVALDGGAANAPPGKLLIGRDLVTQALYKAVMDSNPSSYDGPGWERHPVETLTFAEAEEFCKRLTPLVGRTCSLPTEADWEYACRAGTATPFFCGTALTAAQANFDNAVGRTTPVGSYPPNGWGLTDMAGNVWQWCRPSADSRGQKVLRGGAWSDPRADCEAGRRRLCGGDLASPTVGFRVAIRD